MDFKVKRVEYYDITVEYQIREASKLLSNLAAHGIDFLSFKAVPAEERRTLFTLFSESGQKMAEAAKEAGFNVNGPHSALLIIGVEKLGALAEIYEKLSRADINVNESSGIAHIKGAYGVILYLKQEDCEKAIIAFEEEKT